MEEEKRTFEHAAACSGDLDHRFFGEEVAQVEIWDSTRCERRAQVRGAGPLPYRWGSPLYALEVRTPHHPSDPNMRVRVAVAAQLRWRVI